MAEPTINMVALDNSARMFLMGVLKAISVWSLEDHKTGQKVKVITYPILDQTEGGSSEVVKCSLGWR
jgi:hypothetical protein